MKDNIAFFFKIWGVILLLNQAIIFGGCFRPTCIMAALPHTGVISFILFYFFTREPNLDDIKTEEEEEFIKVWGPPSEAYEAPKEEEKYKKPNAPKNDPLKEMGDKYEKYIGSKFEEKGNLVIYNGFIKGYDDKGVDIISISQAKNEINLVQCKNWTKKRMDIEDIKNIYTKLKDYDLDCFNISISVIKEHLVKVEHSGLTEQFIHAKQHKGNYIIRKTLYVSSDKVMDLNIGEFLTMISPNIFKYLDMKIVIQE